MLTSVRMDIPVPGGMVHAQLHCADAARGAAVLVSGARGGLDGPSGIYPELASRLQMAGIAAVRLNYRSPNRLTECVADVHAAVTAIRRHGVERAVLIGWSFGGAVAIAAGVCGDTIVGVATLASQTLGTRGIGALAPRALLLLHGTADAVLPPECSQDLYARAGDPRELVLYPGTGHDFASVREQVLTKLHAWAVERLPSARDGRFRTRLACALDEREPLRGATSMSGSRHVVPLTGPLRSGQS